MRPNRRHSSARPRPRFSSALLASLLLASALSHANAQPAPNNKSPGPQSRIAPAPQPQPHSDQFSPPDLIRSGKLLDLTNEADREFRLLLVYSIQRRENDWFANLLAESETLSEFVRDHCLVARVIASENPDDYNKVIVPLTAATTPSEPDGFKLGLSKNAGAQWASSQKIFMFHRGKFDRSVPNSQMPGKWAGGAMLDRVSLPGMTPAETQTRNLQKLNPLQILYEASFLLDKFRTQDQTWIAHHLNRARARITAAHPLACELDDNLAAPIREPAQDLTARGKPWRAAEFFRQLEQARSFTRDGSYYDATGPVCWLWENWRLGPPELRPAVLFFVTDLARQLAQSRPSSREKFNQARELALAWRHTGDYADRLSWYALNETLGDYDEAIRVLDLALHGPDEGSMTSPADLAAYEIMLGRRWSEPWRYDAKSVEWFTKLGTQLDKRPPAAKRSAGNDDTLWEMFEDFRRQTWIADGCRLYAAALKADDARTASETTTLLFARDADGDIRRALVATAIAAGVARPEHREWLATSSGGLTTQIREALDLALADRPEPPAPNP